MKRKTVLAVATAILTLVFSGCATKEIVRYEPMCLNISTVQIPEPINIRVAKEDADIAKKYTNALRAAVEAQNKKIEKHNLICDAIRGIYAEE